MEWNEFLGDGMVEEQTPETRDLGSCFKLPNTTKFTDTLDSIKSKSTFANDRADPRQLISVRQQMLDHADGRDGLGSHKHARKLRCPPQAPQRMVTPKIYIEWGCCTSQAQDLNISCRPLQYTDRLNCCNGTFALNAAVWFLRGLLLIRSPLHSHLKAAGEQNFHLNPCPNLRYRLSGRD